LKSIYLIILCIFFIGNVELAEAAGEYSYLLPWVGHHPSEGPNKKQPDLFKMPEMTRFLKRLLPQKEYKILTKVLNIEMPVEKDGNFILVDHCKQHCCPCESSILIFDLSNDAAFAVFYDSKRGGNDRSTTCFSTGKQLSYLPDSIKERILEMHIPRMKDADKLVPQNPWIDLVSCKVMPAPNKALHQESATPTR
jgi:hypothetical protein